MNLSSSLKLVSDVTVSVRMSNAQSDSASKADCFAYPIQRVMAQVHRSTRGSTTWSSSIYISSNLMTNVQKNGLPIQLGRRYSVATKAIQIS